MNLFRMFDAPWIYACFFLDELQKDLLEDENNSEEHLKSNDWILIP